MFLSEEGGDVIKSSLFLSSSCRRHHYCFVIVKIQKII